jgi:type IV secretion system protein VirB2
MLKEKSKSPVKQAVVVALLISLTVAPELAMAGTNPILNGVNWLRDLLNSTLATSVAILAITVLGYMAFAGRLAGDIVIRFVVGIILVFGGARIVGLISGSL